MENSMQIIIIIVIVIIFIANQVEKNKKNNLALGTKGARNIVPQPNNAYQVNQPSGSRSEKAFRESSTYQTSHLVNEQLANREAVIDVLNEFNESLDRMNTRKEVNKSNKSKKAKTSSSGAANKKETKVEVINLSKPEEKTPNNDNGYGWSIFDDFAASDALYLARKDVESRKAQKVSYM